MQVIVLYNNLHDILGYNLRWITDGWILSRRQNKK